MKTGNVGYVHAQYNQFSNVNNQDNDVQGYAKRSSKFELNILDTYTPSVEGAADPATIDRLWQETNHAGEAIRKLVQAMLGKADASGQGFWAVRTQRHFKLSEEDRAQALEMISEDGFFGVKQTTARIMDFAKALVGENASEDQINNMRDAVQKGFDEVARLFGGFDNLPDVTKQTYDAIMKAFDEWLGIGASDETSDEAAVE